MPPQNKGTRGSFGPHEKTMLQFVPAEKFTRGAFSANIVKEYRVAALFVNTLLNLLYADAQCIFLLHASKEAYTPLPANIAAPRLFSLSANCRDVGISWGSYADFGDCWRFLTLKSVSDPCNSTNRSLSEKRCKIINISDRADGSIQNRNISDRADDF
jgi:hypothetical protein